MQSADRSCADKTQVIKKLFIHPTQYQALDTRESIAAAAIVLTPNKTSHSEISELNKRSSISDKNE